MSTNSQKEIFTRLHAEFTRINADCANKTQALLKLEDELIRMKTTFNEQNETLRRYEEAFGTLPPLGFAGIGTPKAPVPPPWLSEPPAMHDVSQAPSLADLKNEKQHDASQVRASIRQKFRDHFGWEDGEFLYSKIFGGDWAQ